MTERSKDQPTMPGESAKQRGEVPTGQDRNQDYGKGRQSGVVDKSEHEQAQDAELEMNERNH